MNELHSGDAEDSGASGILRALRARRLVRVVRFVRIMRFKKATAGSPQELHLPNSLTELKLLELRTVFKRNLQLPTARGNEFAQDATCETQVFQDATAVDTLTHATSPELLNWSQSNPPVIQTEDLQMPEQQEALQTFDNL